MHMRWRPVVELTVVAQVTVGERYRILEGLIRLYISITPNDLAGNRLSPAHPGLQSLYGEEEALFSKMRARAPVPIPMEWMDLNLSRDVPPSTMDG